MAKPEAINLTDLTTVKSTETKNENLRTLIKEVETYNTLLKDKVRSVGKLVGALDHAMVAAAHWLTSKPKTGTDKNTRRREAVLRIVNQISWTFAECFAVRPVVGNFSKPGKPNEGNYWLERIDPKHRAGFVLLPYYDKWSVKAPEPYEPYQTFWSYLDTVDHTAENKAWDLDRKLALDASLTEEDKAKAEAEHKKVLDEIATRAKNVAQLTADARAPYLRRIVNGVLINQDGEPFDTDDLKTHFSGAGWAIFVVAMNNDIYSNSHLKGEFHHSTFLSGAPVKCAGELVVEKGKVVVVTAKSGHYQPKAEDLQRFVKHLQSSSALAAGAMVCGAFGGAFQAANEFVNKGVAGKTLQSDEVWAALPKSAQSPEVKAYLTVYLLPDDKDRERNLNGEARWGLTVERDGLFFLRVKAVQEKSAGSRSQFKAGDLILSAKATVAGKEYRYRVRHADGTEEDLGLLKLN
jgi:hypothetical protein